VLKVQVATRPVIARRLRLQRNALILQTRHRVHTEVVYFSELDLLGIGQGRRLIDGIVIAVMLA
jgi:hypothetical protein